METQLNTVTILRQEYDRFLSQELELRELRRLVYGSKSERFISNEAPQQTSLFDTPPVAEDIAPVKEKISYTRNKAKQKPVRKSLPAHLPRHEEVIEPSNLSEDAVKIGEEVTETYEYEPGKLSVKRTVRPKYLQNRPKDLDTLSNKKSKEIVIAPLAKVAFPKSNAGNSLVAYICVGKYIDHLPLYRLLQIFSRENVDISSSTIDGWLNMACQLIVPLYNLLLKKIQSSNYLQADESTIKVKIDKSEKEIRKRDISQITGYYWVLHAVEEKLVVFRYYDSRSGNCAVDLLEDFSGLLQTDGYRAYDKVGNRQDITHLACMAHVRRYFEKALATDKELASEAMRVIQKLYSIESTLKEETDTSIIEQVRQREAKPLLESWYNWLKTTQLNIAPKVRKEDKLLVTINYTLSLWDKLTGYVDNGNALIDNNAIENKIRPLALGRKNYLFAGSHKGAERGGMMYSFFACCKFHQVNPYDWLKHVFDTMPNIDINDESQLNQLLPQYFNKEE